MASRLTTRINEWFERAVEQHSQGENITWDMAFNMSDQGPVLMLAFFMPGAILGSSVQTVMVLNNIIQMAEPDAERVFIDALENLRKGRSEQMNNLTPEQGAPVGNGHGVR